MLYRDYIVSWYHEQLLHDGINDTITINNVNIITKYKYEFVFIVYNIK